MRVLALRHDPLKPHLAGVRKHERAILVVEVLVEAQPRCRTPEQARERRLAHCERVAPQIVAVEFDQVEGIEEHARVVTPIPDRCFGVPPSFSGPTPRRIAARPSGSLCAVPECAHENLRSGGKKAGGSDHAPDGIAARSGASAISRDRCRYEFGNVICADTDALQAWPPFNGW